jgi:hypothetical protein
MCLDVKENPLKMGKDFKLGCTSTWEKTKGYCLFRAVFSTYYVFKERR